MLKKTRIIKEQPETGVEHKDIQSGAIVEPADSKPRLLEAVVRDDKRRTEVQPALTVVADKGEARCQLQIT